MDLLPGDLPDAAFKEVAMALLQLEIPIETVRRAIGKCAELGIPVILNPAPGRPLERDLLQGLFSLHPTKLKLNSLPALQSKAWKLWKQPPGTCSVWVSKMRVITLGSKASTSPATDLRRHYSCVPVVEAIDSTAAGDVFNGAILKSLADGTLLPDACRFACRAAALSVTRMGAQSSAPYQHECPA